MRQINSHTLSSILGHGYHAKPIVERYLFLLKEEKGRWNPDFDTNFQLTWIADKSTRKTEMQVKSEFIVIFRILW